MRQEYLIPLAEERFRPVFGWDGLYSVSDNGRVVCHKRKWKPNASIKTQSVGNNGYNTVTLKAGGRTKSYTVHSLVVRAFIDKDYTRCGLVCDHIDRDRSNNLLSNLRVVTQRENNINKPRTNMLGASFHKRHKKWISHIVIGSKKVHLGYYDTEIEAHNVYMDRLAEFIPISAFNGGS